MFPFLAIVFGADSLLLSLSMSCLDSQGRPQALVESIELDDMFGSRMMSREAGG